MSAEFELLRFEAAPVSATVAVVELDGEFGGPAPARVRLLIERGGRGVEVPAITSGGEGPWSATFAIALADLVDDRTEYALAPGRGPLIGLPAPESGGTPGSDRYVELARQTNDLRHQLDEATEAASRVDELRADLAVAERRAEQEAGRAQEAERAAASARAARDDAIKTGDAAREEQSSLRKALRETETQLTETERERAALRARAESADRAVTDLTGRVDALERRAREAEERALAAEDETRIARRDLRDTRARLESVLRDQRHPGPERRGYEVPDPEPGAVSAAKAADADTSTDADTGATDVLETGDIAADDDAPQDPDDDAPRTTATATHAKRVVRIWDDPEEDDHPDEDRDARHAPEDLTPGRIGARYIEPSTTKPSMFTPARIMVGIALLLLVVALIAILLGAGLV